MACGWHQWSILHKWKSDPNILVLELKFVDVGFIDEIIQWIKLNGWSFYIHVVEFHHLSWYSKSSWASFSFDENHSSNFQLLKHQRSGQQSVVAGLTIFERSDLTRHGCMKLASSGSWCNGFTPLVKFEPVLGEYQKMWEPGLWNLDQMCIQNLLKPWQGIKKKSGSRFRMN